MTHDEAVEWVKDMASKRQNTSATSSTTAPTTPSALKQASTVTPLIGHASVDDLIGMLNLDSMFPIPFWPSPYTFTYMRSNATNGTASNDQAKRATDTGARQLLDVSYKPAHNKFSTHLAARQSIVGRDATCVYATSYSFDTETVSDVQYTEWNQVGNCFYCDSCTQTITSTASVQNTWSVGLTADFEEAIHIAFGFQRTTTTSLSSAVGCTWQPGETFGCHSIWFQAGFNTFTGQAKVHQQGNFACFGDIDDSQPATVKKAQTDKGFVGGNPGCGSGCQGDDNRQCPYGNDGGVLWKLVLE